MHLKSGKRPGIWNSTRSNASMLNSAGRDIVNGRASLLTTNYTRSVCQKVLGWNTSVWNWKTASGGMKTPALSSQRPQADLVVYGERSRPRPHTWVIALINTYSDQWLSTAALSGMETSQQLKKTPSKPPREEQPSCKQHETNRLCHKYHRTYWRSGMGDAEN